MTAVVSQRVVTVPGVVPAAKTLVAEPLSLPSKNPALYTTKDHRIYSAESPALNPTPDECIVHVRANGICG